MDTNDAMSPVPLAGNPIEGALLVQLYCVAVPLNTIPAVETPAHKVWLPGLATVATGLTVTTTLSPVLLQPFAVVVST
jgi:hypothetical protein